MEGQPKLNCHEPMFRVTILRLTLVILHILLMLSRNLCCIVEQPRDSLLYRHKRFEWCATMFLSRLGQLIQYATLVICTMQISMVYDALYIHIPLCLAKVHQCRFFAMQHGAGTLTTVVYSNMKEVSKLRRGRLMKKEQKHRTTSKTTRN